MSPETPSFSSRSPEEILATAIRQFAEDCEAERDIRDEAEKDIAYEAGDQWDAKVKNDRMNAGRPALVDNRLPAYCQQVSNEARQQKPQIRFTPVENADEDTAEVLEGIARHIQYDSHASTAYETAVEYQVAGGFGFYGLQTDYCDSQSFDQELKVRIFPNPFCVYGILIPACLYQKPRHAFVIERMSREDYEAEYGKSDAVESFASGDEHGWITRDDIQVAEYWFVETKRKKIARLASGEEMNADDVPEGAMVMRTRESSEDTVYFCKLNGAEIIPGTETRWVTESIPIFPVLAKSKIVNGKPQLFSLVRFMRDPQQLINYAKSRLAETLATQPVSPWIMAEGQDKGYEQEWATAHLVMRHALKYKPQSFDGHLVPPPQRQVFEPPIAALSNFLAQEIDSLKSISGIFDASMGNRSNETSGIAIARRDQQAQTTNAHFLGNLERAHELGGVELAAAIPKVYDTPRVVRMLGEDETRKVVRVNQMYQDENGKDRHYQLSAGKYDVVVTTGRGWSSKRMETWESLSQVIQGNPGLMQIIGDIVFRNSDMAGANEISERFKKMLPPNLADDEQQKPVQIPPQMQQQMQALSQQHQQLTDLVNQLQNEIDTKAAELASRERIASMQEETKRTIALAQLNAQEGKTLLENELAVLHQKVDMLHQANMQDTQQGHQMMMAQQQAQQQMQQQQMQQPREASSGQVDLSSMDTGMPGAMDEAA